MRHPTTETILDFLENKAASASLDSLEEHLTSCGRCESKSQEFQQLTGFLQEDAANEPPSHLLEWSVELFQPVLRPQGSTLRRIFGALVFDSFEQPLPAGIRSVGSVPRQLLFKAGDLDIDVRIESDMEDRISLAGQVLSESTDFFENTPVRLESHGMVRYKTQTNPVGEFSFDAVPQETYHLSMDLPEGQLTLFCVHRSQSRFA